MCAAVWIITFEQAFVKYNESRLLTASRGSRPPPREDSPGRAGRIETAAVDPERIATSPRPRGFRPLARAQVGAAATRRPSGQERSDPARASGAKRARAKPAARPRIPQNARSRRQGHERPTGERSPPRGREPCPTRRDDEHCNKNGALTKTVNDPRLL